jgi:hypothetical protein
MKPSSEEVYNELLDKIQRGVPQYEIENWLSGLGLKNEKSQSIILSLKKQLAYDRRVDVFEKILMELFMYPLIFTIAVFFLINFIVCTTNSKLHFDNYPFLNEMFKWKGNLHIYFFGITALLAGFKEENWMFRIFIILFFLLLMFLKFYYFADIYDMFKL